MLIESSTNTIGHNYNVTIHFLWLIKDSRLWVHTPCNNMDRQIYLRSFEYTGYAYYICIDIYNCNGPTPTNKWSNGVNCTLVEMNMHANNFNQLITLIGKMTRVQSMHWYDSEWNRIGTFLSDFHEYSSFFSVEIGKPVVCISHLLSAMCIEVLEVTGFTH